MYLRPYYLRCPADPNSSPQAQLLLVPGSLHIRTPWIYDLLKVQDRVGYHSVPGSKREADPEEDSLCSRRRVRRIGIALSFCDTVHHYQSSGGAETKLEPLG
jgi:hypothetical protein